MPDFRAYVRANLPPLGLGPEREAEIAEELSQQLEEHYHRARTEVGSDEQAWERARQQVPSWEKLAGEIRAVEKPAPKLTTKPPVARPARNGSARLLADFLDDVRFGLRLLVKSPGFSVPALLTLALAIGLNAALFGVVRKVLIEPLPFPHAERIVTLWENNTNDGIERDDVAPANFLDWRERQRVFEHVASNNPWSLTYLSDGNPENLRGMKVSDGFFEIFATPPLLGRVFDSRDHESGRDKVVVLTYGLWQSRFGADRTILGHTIVLNGDPYTVIGVLPPEFRPQLHRPERVLYVPQVIEESWPRQRRSTYLKVIGRLKPEVSLAEAGTNLDTIARQLAEEFPESNKGIGVSIVPLRENFVGDVEPALVVLMAAAGLVLLIAATNVANLLVARGVQRQKEMAVRLALGAGTGRLARQLLTESGVLAVSGSLLGLLLSYLSLKLLLTLIPFDIPRLSEATVDGGVLAFGAALCILITFVVGTMPALQALRLTPSSQLKEGARSSGGRSALGSRRILLATQVCLAVVLLAGAGLLLRSLERLLSVQPGFAVERVVILQQFVWDEYPTNPQKLAYVQQALENLHSVPGVRSAALGLGVPLLPEFHSLAASVTTEAQVAPANAYSNTVTGGYFETLGTPLIRGRVFSSGDDLQSEKVVVINETMARRFWPGVDPLGRTMNIHNRTYGAEATAYRVIGLVGDVRHLSLMDQPRPEFFLPFSQNPLASLTFLVRTNNEADALIPSLKEALWSLDRRIPFYGVRTIDGLLAASLAPRRFQTIILSLMALLALTLAAVGIYAVISFAAASRTKEVGIRVALGATSGSVVGVFIREGAWITATGVAIGAPLALGLTRFLRSQLYEVSPADPLTYIAIGLLLLGVAVCASLFPAFRAARADPVRSLRTE